jgi:transcriptional regulator of acetoin/glycerol metabolism
LRDLPSSISGNRHALPESDLQELSYHQAKERVLEDFEKNYLKIQLNKNEWNISKTAESCRIDRRTIHRLIKKYDLKS